MTTPYYSDDAVTLYHGDCREVLADMADESVAAVITDPPYSAEVHANARAHNAGGVREGITAFDAFTFDGVHSILAEAGRISHGWVIATLAYEHAFALRENPPEGLRLMRLGVWVKANPTPQLSGDRPAHGWESIAYMHRDDRRSKWNGGGRHGNFYAPIDGGQGHPTAKPLPMVADWVRLFTNPGDLILDPFAGSGTTLRAAKDEGRRAIGVELDEAYCEVIAKRLSQDTLFGDVADTG